MGSSYLTGKLLVNASCPARVSPQPLPANLQSVFDLIAALANNVQGYCWARTSWLATRLDCSRVHAWRILNKLVAFGRLKIEDVSGSHERRLRPVFLRPSRKQSGNDQVTKSSRTYLGISFATQKNTTNSDPAPKAEPLPVAEPAVVVVPQEIKKPEPTEIQPLTDEQQKALIYCLRVGVFPSIARYFATHHAARVLVWARSGQVEQKRSPASFLHDAIKKNFDAPGEKPLPKVVQVPKENQGNHAAYEQITAPVQNHAPAPPTRAESPKNGQNSDISAADRAALDTGGFVGESVRRRLAQKGIAV